jgi:hypothetical protein
LQLIDFPKDHCQELQDVLENDLTMLKETGVMDYSLLLIIIHFPRQSDPDYEHIINLFGDARFAGRMVKSGNKKYIYIFGLIDYLQKFNVAKFFENKYKSIVYGNEIKYVSAVDPMIYSERMSNFAKEYIFISQK